MPEHWLSTELWFFHIEQKTRELVASEEWWPTFVEAVAELDRLEVT